MRLTKKFMKDNRGQVLYAVIVTVMFMGVLSMIAMGLTLSNYHDALDKQQHVSDYYAADAVAELIRIGKLPVSDTPTKIDAETFETAEESSTRVVTVEKNGNAYTITADTATIVMTIEDNKFTSWEVSYHAEQPAE